MILVTGAAGLVGSFITKLFLDHGFKVRALVHQSEIPKWILSGQEKNLEVVKTDLLEHTAYPVFLDRIETIIHCAAKVSYDPRESDAILRMNLIVTRDLINACIEENIPNFIHISSIAAVGNKIANDEILNEKSMYQEGERTTEYARSKHQAELEIWRGQAEGLNVGILNPSVILGPRSTDQSSAKIFEYVLQEKKYYPSGGVATVDVRNVAEAALSIVKGNIWGERFIISNDTYSYKELLTKIAKSMGVKPVSKPLRKTTALIVSYISYYWSLLTRSKLFLNPTVVKLSFTTTSYNNQKSKEVLGVKYHSLEDTLVYTANILKENYIKKD